MRYTVDGAAIWPNRRVGHNSFFMKKMLSKFLSQTKKSSNLIEPKWKYFNFLSGSYLWDTL
jgi:hypothetical protein